MLIEPKWVDSEEVVAIHRREIEYSGGLYGVRDLTLFESALVRPQNLFLYNVADSTIPRLAAAYGFGIVQNHPFIDGNKRAALLACSIFLLHNHFDFFASADEKYQTFIALADKKLSEDELAAWFEAHTRQV